VGEEGGLGGGKDSETFLLVLRGGRENSRVLFLGRKEGSCKEYPVGDRVVRYHLQEELEGGISFRDLIRSLTVSIVMKKRGI